MEYSRLTPTQQLIFNEVALDPFLNSHFYFTGGTALSSVYLHHRESEDLDFFSETSFDPEVIQTKASQWSKKLQFKIHIRQIETVNIFTFTFANGEILKVDFVHYPHTRLEKGTHIENFPVDSMTDIAVNKLLTISHRTEVKDFVDLYFLLKKYSFWDLRIGVDKKFNVELEPFISSSDFAKVKEFTTLPKMLVPITLGELQDFFITEAKTLAMQAVE